MWLYIYMYIKLSNTCVSMWFFEQTRCLAQVPLMQQKRFPSWWKLKINLESSGWYHLMGFSNTFPNSGKWSIPILRSSPWLDPICPFVMMCHDVSRFQLPLMLSGSTPGFICGSGAPTRGRKGEMVRMKHMRFESCLETPNPCMTAPSVRIVLQVFATATSCGTAIRDGRNNSKISWNKSVAGPTLPGCWAYDSRWPKIIKHAGKAFPPWAKHPRIRESLRFNKFQQESLGSLSDGHVERTLLCMMRKDLHLVSSRTVRMTRDWTCGQSTQTAWHRFKTDLIHVLLYGVVSGNHAVAGMWPYVWEFCDICITAICKLFQDVGAPNGFSCCSKMVKRPHWEHGYAGRQHSKTVWSTEGRKWQTIRPQLHTSPQKAQHASFPLRFIKLWQGALVTELYFCLPSLPLDLFGITALGTVQQPLLEENVQALAWAHPWALERLWTYGLR